MLSRQISNETKDPKMKVQFRLLPVRQAILVGFCLLLFVTGCSSTGESQTSFQPASSDVSLEVWAQKYPLQYNDWQDSVHGQAYLKGNTDAPGCTDCHPLRDAKRYTDPDGGEIKTAAFHLDIPGRCARCHSDQARMSQYDLSADVYGTYLADYHGTTIEYYRATAPTTWRYEAVCSDCHGSHAVYGPEDEKSSVASKNLPATCQKCHHDAPPNFATAYGHYRPARSPVSTADSPVIFWVKLLYQGMIPVVLGGMVGYIGLDIYHRITRRKNNVEPNS